MGSVNFDLNQDIHILLVGDTKVIATLVGVYASRDLGPQNASRFKSNAP